MESSIRIPFMPLCSLLVGFLPSRRSRCRPGVLLPALGLLCSALACGPGAQTIAVDIVYHQDGQGRAEKVATVLGVSSSGAIWQATHAAQISELYSPDDSMAMSFCQVHGNGLRSSRFTDYQALDLGHVTIETEGEEQILQEVEIEKGLGYRADLDITRFPYDEEREYTVNATGSSEAPAFEVTVLAAPDYRLETIGDNPSGPGTPTIPGDRDLEISWSPGNADTEMFIALISTEEEADLLCRVRDDGAFTVSKDVLEKIATGPANVILERYSETQFDTDSSTAGGVESGRVRYAVQRSQRIVLH